MGCTGERPAMNWTRRAAHHGETQSCRAWRGHAVRLLWWGETDYGRNEPSAELLTVVRGPLPACQRRLREKLFGAAAFLRAPPRRGDRRGSGADLAGIGRRGVSPARSAGVLSETQTLAGSSAPAPRSTSGAGGVPPGAKREAPDGETAERIKRPLPDPRAFGSGKGRDSEFTPRRDGLLLRDGEHGRRGSVRPSRNLDPVAGRRKAG